MLHWERKIKQYTSAIQNSSPELCVPLSPAWTLQRRLRALGSDSVPSLSLCVSPEHNRRCKQSQCLFINHRDSSLFFIPSSSRSHPEGSRSDLSLSDFFWESKYQWHLPDLRKSQISDRQPFNYSDGQRQGNRPWMFKSIDSFKMNLWFYTGIKLDNAAVGRSQPYC